MTGGILGSRHIQTHFANILDRKDSKYVKTTQDGRGLKIGYSSRAGETKFQQLSDAPVIGKSTPKLVQDDAGRWREAKDAHGNTVMEQNWKYSPRADQIRDAMGKIVEKMSPAVQDQAAQIIKRLLEKRGMDSHALSQEQLGDIAAMKNEAPMRQKTSSATLFCRGRANRNRGLTASPSETSKTPPARRMRSWKSGSKNHWIRRSHPGGTN